MTWGDRVSIQMMVPALLSHPKHYPVGDTGEPVLYRHPSRISGKEREEKGAEHTDMGGSPVNR